MKTIRILLSLAIITICFSAVAGQWEDAQRVSREDYRRQQEARKQREARERMEQEEQEYRRMVISIRSKTWSKEDYQLALDIVAARKEITKTIRVYDAILRMMVTQTIVVGYDYSPWRKKDYDKAVLIIQAYQSQQEDTQNKSNEE